MNRTFLVITSIADDSHEILNYIGQKAKENNIPCIVIGDTKSPDNFEIDGIDFYSVERQKSLGFKLAENLPYKHYARKNLGYLIAMKNGAEVIIETDDDNIPLDGFWDKREKIVKAKSVKNDGWVNVYKYFSDENIWPRGFSLEHIKDEVPKLGDEVEFEAPIQQGLADENPDVDAIYRLVNELPINFKKNLKVHLGENAFCPFNSQNTTWFKEAFPLMYLPSYCSFRMTDIWRSFVAQRIAWEYDWGLLFHESTVKQERNDHDLMKDFEDEVVGNVSNNKIIREIVDLKLDNSGFGENLIRIYSKLIDMELVATEELILLESWLYDIKKVS
jgi:hypothetical protein